MRRRSAERWLLPLLFALLPLLTAVVVLLAPISIANAVTIQAHQQRLGQQQLSLYESQLDRVGQLVRREPRLESLLQHLQAIPGLRVQAPPALSLEATRRQAQESLQTERLRLRQQLQRNTNASLDALLRRSLVNTGQALVMALIVWGMHRMAMQEMEHSIPYLAWALSVEGAESHHQEVMAELLAFQRRCVALSPTALLDQLATLLRGMPRPTADDDAPAMVDSVDGTPLEAMPPTPPAGPSLWRGRGRGVRLAGGPAATDGDLGLRPRWPRWPR